MKRILKFLGLLTLGAAASGTTTTRPNKRLLPPEAGIASWYGEKLQGLPMANGEPFDRERYTCASRTYPLGSYLRVTFPTTGKSVIVEVTDRGPYSGTRILDLSERAAYAIGLHAYGFGIVLIQPVERLHGVGIVALP
jgi:rare lipoprotein A